MKTSSLVFFKTITTTKKQAGGGGGSGKQTNKQKQTVANLDVSSHPNPAWESGA